MRWLWMRLQLVAEFQKLVRIRDAYCRISFGCRIWRLQYQTRIWSSLLCCCSNSSQWVPNITNWFELLTSSHLIYTLDQRKKPPTSKSVVFVLFCFHSFCTVTHPPWPRLPIVLNSSFLLRHVRILWRMDWFQEHKVWCNQSCRFQCLCQSLKARCNLKVYH